MVAWLFGQDLRSARANAAAVRPAFMITYQEEARGQGHGGGLRDEVCEPAGAFPEVRDSQCADHPRAHRRACVVGSRTTRSPARSASRLRNATPCSRSRPAVGSSTMKHPRVREQGLGDLRPLQHPAGVGAQRPFACAGQVGQLEQFADPGPRSWRACP